MAIKHARSGEMISLRPLGDAISTTKTSTLFKTDAMEAIRLVLPAGKKIAEHKAPGEITVHCLEGQIKFSFSGKSQMLSADEMLHLQAAELHAVEAIEDSTVLVTIVMCVLDDVFVR